MKPKTASLVLAGLLAAGALTWIVVVRPAEASPDVEVRTVAVSRGPITHRVVAAGTLDVVGKVDIGAQVSGTIQSLDADFNSVVRRGEVLARLDPSGYEAQEAKARAALSQARAEVARRQAALSDATTKLDRARELSKAGLATEADLETAQTTANQAQADLKSAQSSVVVAEASLRQAQVNLEYTVVRSPIDGIVVSRQVEVGQTVAVRRDIPVLFTIAEDFKHLELDEAIDESDVSYVQAGQPVSFTVSGFPDVTFKGVVSHVRLEPDQEATVTELPNGLLRSRAPRVITYTAVVDVDNSQERLRPGMTAIATIVVSRCGDCVRVPNDALAFKPSEDVLRALNQQPLEGSPTDAASQQRDSESVWTYRDDRLEPAMVETGAQGDQFTELVDGDVAPGEPVVTSARLPVAQLPTAQSPLAPQRPRFRRGFGGDFRRGFRGR
jgi:HlyD family secretion protein